MEREHFILFFRGVHTKDTAHAPTSLEVYKCIIITANSWLINLTCHDYTCHGYM